MLLFFFLLLLLPNLHDALPFSEEVLDAGVAYYHKHKNEVSSGLNSFQDLAETVCLKHQVTTTQRDYAMCVSQVLGSSIKEYLATCTTASDGKGCGSSTVTRHIPVAPRLRILTHREILELYVERVHMTEAQLQLHAIHFLSHLNETYYTKKKNKLALLLDMPRHFVLFDFTVWTDELHIKPRVVLSLNHNEPELFLPAFHKVEVLDYAPFDPEKNENDLLTLHLSRNDYDFFLSANVLEHVQDPLLAVMSMYKHLCPGGYAFTSVPTSNRPHDTPIHFFHFSPIALATTFQRAGFEVLRVGYWGNSHYKEWVEKSNSWPVLEQIIDRYGKKEALFNDVLNPVQTWILARRQPEETDGNENENENGLEL